MEYEPRGTQKRRRFVRAVGAGAAAVLAGCLGENGDEDDGEGGTAKGDWQTAMLTDSTTGEEFRVADFEQPTLVHTFAANCLTCARQQAAFVTLREGRDDIEIVELSVDPNDTPEGIAAHAESGGLDWHVGVAPEAVTRSLIDEFGQAVSVSAQSPVIIVCADGTTNTVSKVADPDELELAVEDGCSL